MKIKLKPGLLLFIITLAVVGCENENEDITPTVNKNGAVETSVHITHLNSEFDELLTTHTIWVKNNMYKTVQYRDTLPALGVQSTEAENKDGDTRRVSVPKEYEIYITVK